MTTKPGSVILRIAIMAWAALMAFLPVGAMAASGDVAFIPVPKNVVYAGQQIDSSLLRDRKVPAKYLDRVSVFTSHSGLVGMIARTTLVPNRPIPTNYVTEPNVVSVNQPAIMRYASRALVITAEVMPLNSAKLGGLVKARNIRTGVIVTGIAQADGTISVGIAQ